MTVPEETSRGDHSPSMLLEGARAGHPRAWARLYDHHAGRLRAELEPKIPPRLRARFDAEDLVQATFLNAFRSIDTFEERGVRSFEVWLGRIATSLLIDLIRHHQALGRDPGLERGCGREEPGAPPLVSSDPSPLAGLVAEEQSTRLRTALRRLPDLDREVLRLRCETQLSWRAVSRRVRHAVHTARRHHDWGLESLRREIV